MRLNYVIYKDKESALKQLEPDIILIKQFTTTRRSYNHIPKNKKVVCPVCEKSYHRSYLSRHYSKCKHKIHNKDLKLKKKRLPIKFLQCHLN